MTMRTGLLSIALLALACGGRADDTSPGSTPATTSPESSSGADTKVDPEALNLGLVVPLTGPDQKLGERIRDASMLAAEQLNAFGGLRGKRVKIVVRDDASDPSTSRRRILELAGEGVVVGIGPATSRAALASLDLFRAGKVVYVSPSATARELDDADADAKRTSFTPTVLFRTRASDRVLGTAVAQWASAVLDGPTPLRRCISIGTVRETEPSAMSIAEATKLRFTLLSLRTEPDVDISRDTPVSVLRDAVTAVVQRAMKEKTCVLVAASAPIAAAYARFLSQAVEVAALPPAQLTVVAAGTTAADLVREARGTMDPETRYLPVAGWTVLAVDRGSTVERAAFESAWGSKFPATVSDEIAASAYDATLLLAGATARAFTPTDTGVIASELGAMSRGRSRVTAAGLTDLVARFQANEDVNYDGASGPIDFSFAGRVANDVVAWQLDVEGALHGDGRYTAAELGDE